VYGPAVKRIGRLLSVHTTCRLQHRPLHAYLTNACTAHDRGHPVPLLSRTRALNAYAFRHAY